MCREDEDQGTKGRALLTDSSRCLRGFLAANAPEAGRQRGPVRPGALNRLLRRGLLVVSLATGMTACLPGGAGGAWVKAAEREQAGTSQPPLARTFSGHTAYVQGVAFSPDGTRLASASGDGTLRLWGAATGEVQRTFRVQSPVNAVAFSPDGTRLASASSDHSLRLWDVPTGEVLCTFNGHTSSVLGVAFSPDGTRLVSASGDGTLRLWRLATGEVLRTFSGHTSSVLGVAFSPDGTRLASASEDATLKLWDLVEGRALRTYSGHKRGVNSVAFSPDGKRLASAGADETLKLWDVATGAVLRTYSGHNAQVVGVAFSPDGTRLASASWDATLRLWDVETGDALSTLSGHTQLLTCVAFNQDGTSLASASYDKALLWTLEAAPVQSLAPARQPPILACTPTFEEPSGNNVLDAEETASIRLTLANAGKGPARGLQATLTGAVPGLVVPGKFDLGDLAPGASKDVLLPLSGTRRLEDGKAAISIAIADRYGFDAPLVVQRLETRAFVAPKFAVALGVEEGNGNGLVERGEELTLKIVVHNLGGAAKGVRLALRGPEGITWLGGRESVGLGDIPAGGWSQATFACLVRNQYAGPEALPLEAAVTEARADIGGTYPVSLTLNQAGPRVVEHVAQARTADRANSPAPELSDPVDQAPVRNSKQPEAHAVIIGIERYKNALLPAVSHARRDATIVREYMTRTLGIPPENIHLLVDHEATLADLRTAISGQLAAAIDDPKSRVYIYFAGHGAPNLKTKRPYLVPHDGNPAYPETSCYPLSELYESLGRLKVPVTVMLDACFSGSAGRGDAPETLLANARPALVELKDTGTPPNVSVLAAANGEQVSSSFAAKKHGLFTYFLLKGLGGAADQDKDGRLTLEELHRFVTPAVQRQARKLNREQTPTLQGAGGMAIY
jgi:WD40 repeat protein